MISLLIFALLLTFQVKHNLDDCSYHNAYMRRKLNVTDGVAPLLAHAAVHALLTFTLGLMLHTLAGRPFWPVPVAAAVDFGVHFIVDRVKAHRSRGVPPSEPRFRRLLGLDQAAHHLTHYALVALLLFA